VLNTPFEKRQKTQRINKVYEAHTLLTQTHTGTCQTQSISTKKREFVKIQAYLALVIGRYATHVVMNGGQYRNGFSRHICTSEDLRRLRNAGKSGGELARRQVMQL